MVYECRHCDAAKAERDRYLQAAKRKKETADWWKDLLRGLAFSLIFICEYFGEMAKSNVVDSVLTWVFGIFGAAFLIFSLVNTIRRFWGDIDVSKSPTLYAFQGVEGAKGTLAPGWHSHLTDAGLENITHLKLEMPNDMCPSTFGKGWRIVNVEDIILNDHASMPRIILGDYIGGQLSISDSRQLELAKKYQNVVDFTSIVARFDAHWREGLPNEVVAMLLACMREDKEMTRSSLGKTAIDTLAELSGMNWEKSGYADDRISGVVLTAYARSRARNYKGEEQK